jgi:hypothetical protein
LGADGSAPSVVEHLLKQVESSQKERDELSRELGRVKLLFAANGTTINIIGETKLTTLIDAETLEISGLVSDHVTEVILWIDFLRRNKAVWDFDHDVVKINGSQHILHSRASKG